MKNVSIRCILLAVVLVGIILSCGCAWDQPGETAAEGSRRHSRVFRINRQEFWSDLDRALLLDQPSKLTDKRLP